MDDIQCVDCFERLHQHLLRYDPEFQGRVAALVTPDAYRSESLPFLLSHLVSVLSGLDDQTAEGKRRIRRLVMEMAEESGAKEVAKGLLIREQGGVFGKPLSPKKTKDLKASFRNLESLREEGEPNVGSTFAARLDAFESLPERITWLRRLLPCLSGLSAFRFLSRIGYPVMIPDSRCQAFFFRLGFLPEVGSDLATQLETCRTGESVARLLKRGVLEINLWVRAFVGGVRDLPTQTALCTASPHCEPCDLQRYCQYFRFRRPRAKDGAKPLPVKQWRPTDRPRERLVQYGASEIEDTELLAIVLRTGSGQTNVMDLARNLLERFGTLEGIEDASLEELQSLHGIGKMKAIELKAVFELGRRQLHRQVVPGECLDSSEKVFECYRGRMGRMKHEEFLLVMLNTKHHVIREEMVSRGGLDSSVVHPRDVFKIAIRASAAAVIFIHNHPSGDPTPSHDDFVVTSRLEEAAGLLRISVLDHVIIGSRSYYSFTEARLMDEEDNEEEAEVDGEEITDLMDDWD